MFGNVVRGIEGKQFEDEIKRVKADRGVKDDTELDVEALQELTRSFKELYEFPTDPREQLEQAIRAVFDSWNGERAQSYRRINRIPDDWGTAVNVQQMVFGNKGDSSGSGVAFSRDEVTGAPRAQRRLPHQRPGRGRRLGRAQHAGHLRPRAGAARGPRRSSWRSCASSSATTATCRTPSSRSRRASCTCCRRATPSARRRPPCASRSTRWSEGLLDKAQALHDDRPRDARRAAAPDLRPAGRVRRARLGRGRLAGRGDRRDRLHRRRRGGRRRPTGAT